MIIFLIQVSLWPNDVQCNNLHRRINHSVLIPQLDLVSEYMFFSLQLHNFLEVRVHIEVVEISVQHIMAEFIVILYRMREKCNEISIG